MEQRIVEGIEACRPGSQDLQSPDLADAAGAVERDPEARRFAKQVAGWDAAVLAAMDDVSVPPGLEGRLLERLNAGAEPTRLAPIVAAATQSTVPPGDSETAVTRAEDSHAAIKSSPVPRRRWLAVCAGSALVASLAVAAALLLSGSPAEIPVETMAEEWLQQVAARPGAWRHDQSPPEGFAVPASVLARPVAWQPIGNYAKGVAYKLEHSKVGGAMLYVVRLLRPGLPSAPPGAPQSNTGGKAIGYWSGDGLIYVLVVPGDERTYRTFVHSGPGPLA